MSKTKKETAKILAKAHFQVEPNLKKVFILEPIDEADPHKPIALLEVVEGTIERGIEPIAFTADPNQGIEYPSVIVEVSPREYKKICSNSLDIGCRGWTVGDELKEN